MKNTLFVLLLIILFSCKMEDKNPFTGLGELKIGAQFDSIPSYSFYKKERENEYVLNKFEISKELGILEDLKIKTQNGKIYSVEFSTGKYSKAQDIDFAMWGVFEETKFSKEQYEKGRGFVLQTYVSNNKKLKLERSYFIGLGNGVKFVYHDFKITNQIEAKLDSIKKLDYIEEKKEFMKDIGK